MKTVVSGAAGRMGARIIALMKDNERLTLHGAIESPDSPAAGRDVGEIIGIGPTGVTLEGDPRKALDGADVLIDFSHADATAQMVSAAAQKGVAVVVGTTGLAPDAVAEIEAASKKMPCVFAPNMSVGVNLLFKVLADVAAVLGDDYDVEIVEAHHRMKKDAPSGTALRMAEVVADALGRNLEEVGNYGRKGLIGERPHREIGIQTVRAGDIVGEHTVLFGGLGERVEITHRASSRDTFARGALRAAAWVTDRAPGLYTMQDVLGIR